MAFVPETKESKTEDPASLAAGAFDEDESHNSFLQALNAWRGVPTQPAEPKEAKPAAEKKSGSFFANLGGTNDW